MKANPYKTISGKPRFFVKLEDADKENFNYDGKEWTCLFRGRKVTSRDGKGVIYFPVTASEPVEV